MLVMPESDPNNADAVPEGFQQLRVGDGYFKQLGPVYGKTQADGGVVVALRVAERHLNFGGVAHGGMLATLADGALGRNIAIARGCRQAQVTVSLTADFLSGARLGDWLEAHVTVTRMGQRLAYANCDLRVGDRHVLRSSAVFAFVDRPWPGPPQQEPPAMEEG
jgi:uncharacterized protein (TIGR00369 family)